MSERSTFRIIPDGRAVRVHSELDQRMRLAISRIVEDESFDEAFILEDVARVPGYNRQFEDWCGDVSGRYVGALALCSTYTGVDYAQSHRVAHAIPRYQRPTGMVGTDQPEDALDLKVAWGQGRLLLGLLEYHSVYPSAEILACAKRLGDYYERSLPYWSQPSIRRQQLYTCYTQGLESVVALYRATGEKHYLETARGMADLVSRDITGMTSERDPNVYEYAGRHSHGVMSSQIGLLALYEETGDQSLLDSVRETCVQIANEMCFIDGSPTEYFPRSERDEGCSTADWLTLNLWLGRFTGDSAYFDMAERIWRNALYGNQAANGGFCHHHIGPCGFNGEGNEAWWCCAYHGPRAYYTLMRHLCTWSDEGVQVQFIEPMNVELPTPHGIVHLSQRTAYPGEGAVEICLEAGPAQGISLSIRIPAWAHVREVRRNNMVVDAQKVSGYLQLSAPVLPGDVVTISFPYQIRVADAEAGQKSLWYGPLLLAAEIAGGVTQGVVIPPLDVAGETLLPALPATDRPFSIPGTHFKMVGLGSAYREPFESLALSRPQVGRLRPLSEQINFSTPPPAVVQFPVIKAETPLLEVELQRALRGKP